MRTDLKRLIAAGAAAAALTACTTGPHFPEWAISPCHDTSVILYFDTDSDAVPDVGRQIVDITAKRLARCRIREIRLLGLADAGGEPAAKLDLSKRRADHVLDAFVQAGLAVPHYTLTAAGDKGAVSAKGAIEPMRRRVNVTVVVQR